MLVFAAVVAVVHVVKVPDVVLISGWQLPGEETHLWETIKESLLSILSVHTSIVLKDQEGAR